VTFALSRVANRPAASEILDTLAIATRPTPAAPRSRRFAQLAAPVPRATTRCTGFRRGCWCARPDSVMAPFGTRHVEVLLGVDGKPLGRCRSIWLASVAYVCGETSRAHGTSRMGSQVPSKPSRDSALLVVADVACLVEAVGLAEVKWPCGSWRAAITLRGWSLNSRAACREIKPRVQKPHRPGDGRATKRGRPSEFATTPRCLPSIARAPYVLRA